MVAEGTLNEFISFNAHFAKSPFIYDPRATFDYREGLDAGSLYVGAA